MGRAYIDISVQRQLTVFVYVSVQPARYSCIFEVMEAEEVEYYWDEETQSYYYYDEATQSYYAYETEGGDATADAEEAAASDGVDANSTSQYLDSGAASNDDAVEDENEKLRSITNFWRNETRESKQCNDGSDADRVETFGRRMNTRKMSFSQHGGLTGCLQQAASDRQARNASVTLSTEEIQRAANLQKARDFALSIAGGMTRSESSKPEVVASSSPHTHSNDGGRAPARRATITRFGTQEFNDPLFQEKLEAMLGGNVSKAR